IVVWFVAVVVAIGIVFALSTVFMASSVGSYDQQTGTYSAGSSLGFFGFLLTWAVGILLIFAAYFIAGVAFLRVGLLTTKGDRIDRAALFSTENLGPYILTVLLMVLCMAIGYMLCILPGIVVSLFLFFAPFYALDKGTSPMEAFRASITLVNRNLAKVVVLFIGAYIAIAIGNLACGLGIIVAFPVVMIAYAYMYRQLNGEPIAP
ncbi:MAG: hypothetical protein JST64_05035, partial [Actinobacteria bacterium]|nr:hypothetical protein [Actinomycetota bacterium]